MGITDVLVGEAELSIKYSFEIATHVTASFLSFANNVHMVSSSLYDHSPMIAGFVAGLLKDTYQTVLLMMFTPYYEALLNQDYIDQAQAVDQGLDQALEFSGNSAESLFT